MKKLALVTGANRGIGFEISRQLAKKGIDVLLASRDPKKGEAAATKLAKEGLTVTAVTLDVSSEESITALAQSIADRYGRLDILINNAGILPRGGIPTPRDVLLYAFTTNTLGPYSLCEAFVPLMKKNGYGRIVNISSGMGQLSEMQSYHPAYRVSKTALNAVTRIFASETEGQGILVNSMCPGWVKTDMGGQGADRTPEEGADTAVWLATLPDNGPTGGFFRDREPIAW
jgi:NAD(P)-dependent dehydrogenase (short-subunit alcohol dehydrogenase family)